MKGVYTLKTLDDLKMRDEIPETGATLEENSRIKARYLYREYGINCFADDTGLEVVALNGAPGVLSARYAGEPKSDPRNVSLLLSNLENETNREARFRTVITLIINGEEHQFEGKVSGVIIADKRGNNGFGYDPVFKPDGHQNTFAEMTSEEKNRISHRGIAVRKLVDYLKAVSSKNEK